MKRLLTLLLLVSAGFAVLVAQEYRGGGASAIAPGLQHVWLKNHNRIPAYLRFDDARRLSAGEWQGYLQRNFKLDPQRDGFMFLREDVDPLGLVHRRYQQTWNGIPVEGSMVIVHFDRSMVYAINGDYFRFDEQISPQPALSASQALQYALNYVDAQAYMWELPEEEAHMQQQGHQHGGQSSYVPVGELVLAAENFEVKYGDFRLAWKFDIYAHEPMSRQYVYVDARDGHIVTTWDRIHTADRRGTALTAYSGARPIVADSTGPGAFRLRESGRGDGIFTWNMLKGTSYANAVDFTDDDNNWNNVNADKDQYATDAHWGAEMTYDYYFLKYGRNSIDNAGFALNSYVHYGDNFANAFWDGNVMTYGDGSPGSSLNNPLTALDIAAHEITHGLTTFSANLVYRDEPGALNESFSDIFGKAVEFYARGNSQFSWVIGGDLGNGIRNMQNPGLFTDPRNYKGANWHTAASDNGGVHINSGVQNHWFYLLCTGGTGVNDFNNPYTVRSIGFDTAGAVAFRNLTTYLTTSSEYDDARFFAILSAIDLYGPCSYVHEAVTNAWYAVGVGSAFSPIAISDFGAANVTTCSEPYVIRFIDQSAGATGYLWNFGDGNTSASASPVHTYNMPGQYNITLTTYGFCGDTATTVKTSFIDVQPAPAVPAVTPQTISCRDQALLVASASNQVRWFDANGQLLYVGDTLRTPNLTSSTTYYAQNATIPAAIFGGPASNAIGTGGNFTNTVQFNYFNTLTESVLRSVKVYASTAGNRTIEYRDQAGTVLASRNVNVPAGESRVLLDFELIPGNDQSIRLAANSTSNLYRNSAGAAYPYNIGNLVSITRSSAGGSTGGVPNSQTYFYFFYDWEVREKGCQSRLEPVTVSLTPLPDPVVTQNVSFCSQSGAVLSGTTSVGTIRWYDANGKDLGTGNTLTTPAQTASTTFYAEAEVASPLLNVGPANGTAVGAGGYHNQPFAARTYFTVLKPIRLKSVWVDANSPGNRTIVLDDASGQQIQSFVVNIPQGQGRVDFNLDLMPGSYGIGGSDMDLFRNNGGAVYPYEIPGLVSMTGNSASQNGFYYYFYDWEVQEPSCTSNRVPVTATMIPGPLALFSFSQNESTFGFSDLSSGATSWRWDFGDGNTSGVQNPQHTYRSRGNFNVTLVVTGASGCSDTLWQTVVVSQVTRMEALLSANLQLYPNPGKGAFTLTASFETAQPVRVEVLNPLGQTIFSRNAEASHSLAMDIELGDAPAGVYLVKLQAGSAQAVKSYRVLR